MAWLYVLIAGIFEVIWATALKYSDGFKVLWPSIVTVVGMIISFYLLSLAMKTLPLGTVYGVWTGIGVLGAVILGIIMFGESVTLLRLIFIACILVGIIGLKLTTQTP